MEKHALKRKEKIGLKLGLENCGKTKVFRPFTVLSFFKLLQKSDCAISNKITKIAISQKNNLLRLFNGGKGTLPFPLEPCFFQGLKLASTVPYFILKI